MRIYILAAFDVFFCNKGAVLLDRFFQVVQNVYLHLIPLERGYEKEVLFNAVFLGYFEYFLRLLV